MAPSQHRQNSHAPWTRVARTGRISWSRLGDLRTWCCSLSRCCASASYPSACFLKFHRSLSMPTRHLYTHGGTPFSGCGGGRLTTSAGGYALSRHLRVFADHTHPRHANARLIRLTWVPSVSSMYACMRHWALHVRSTHTPHLAPPTKTLTLPPSVQEQGPNAPSRPSRTLYL